MSQAIEQLIERQGDAPWADSLKGLWREGDAGGDLPGRYRQAVDIVEGALWQKGYDPSLLEGYSALCREMEEAIAATGDDRRHSFIVVIPVADRPQHITDCLNSLLDLCRRYGYGGMREGRYRKVSVLIADDSRQPENIEAIESIAQDFDRQGLTTYCLGQQEQERLVAGLPADAETQGRLKAILGDYDVYDFSHKGASITRNIAYLKLNALAQEQDNTLFHFIDSDQEFKVRIGDGEREIEPPALNYFHHLDRIFSETDTAILTGKVVGDPPVSPSVMAGNFLQDVIAFLSQSAGLAPGQPCSFHRQGEHQVDDASYHDMADLFGFMPATDAFIYRCTLTGRHDHAACFRDFADRLGRFFDGEHPTRRNDYQYQPPLESVQPARTVYTGNYLFRPECLQQFIPFAPLKLRMAGPVLGRLLKATLGSRFASANLPMLHTRTLQQTGVSEFRPDIDRGAERVDLSGEFERQFYGDVMLFTVEELAGNGYPLTNPGEEHIRECVKAVESDMRHKYLAKQQETMERITRLRSLLDNPEHWWNRTDGPEQAREVFRRFIDNIEHNFGEQGEGYRLIRSPSHRKARLEQIGRALGRYPDDATAWHKALNRTAGDQGQ